MLMRGAKFCPIRAIRVHIWGGLGSQLYGVLASLRLKKQFPARRIQLVFHSSGITRRHIEVALAPFGELLVKFVDDWKDPDKESLSSKRPRLNSTLWCFRAKVKSLLRRFGFLATLSEDKQFSELKPWVVSIRGDYSRISLTEFEIGLVSSILGTQEHIDRRRGYQKETLIHYRSDDLLTQKTLSLVDPARIKSILNFEIISPLIIYTDGDVEQTRQLFVDIFDDLEVLKTSVRETIQECVSAERFIGTSSKISLWVAILKSYHKKGSSFIPKELLPALNCNLEKLSKNGISSY